MSFPILQCIKKRLRDSDYVRIGGTVENTGSHLCIVYKILLFLCIDHKLRNSSVW